MQPRGAEDLRRAVTDALVEAGLTYEGAKAYATPRRLALDVRGVDARSADISDERKGPRTDAPDKAIEGFLRAAGLASVDEAQVRTDPKKGDYYVAVIDKPGREAGEIIAEVLPVIIAKFPWPKSMRWGAASAVPGALRWVRPLQSILCTFGPETEEPVVVDFEIGGVRAVETTRGHRFMAPDAITVRRFDDYVVKLEEGKVMLDPERRKQVIAADARNLAFAQGYELIEDDRLLDEVAGLVEWPVVLLGEFDEAFLEMPDEVIRLTIRQNQKCFVLAGQGADDSERALANRFVMVANIEATDGGAEIARGNAKVVNARLSDAKFFWESDLAVARAEGGFDSWVDGLEAVTFHAKLGSQRQRVEEIVDLATEVASEIGGVNKHVRRAAHLAKADLQSAMVGEFPELQGQMGRFYAEAAGEHADVAAAIAEHYKPQGPSDTVPREPVSVAVALADKLHTLVGFWAIEEKPTGSKDPYALRRAALGVIRLLLENEKRLALKAIIDKTNMIHAEKPDGMPGSADVPDLLSFFHDRLKVHLRDEGVRHDLIDAVLTADADDLLIIARKARALRDLIDSEDGQNLLAGYKRAANILAAEEKKGTKPAKKENAKLFEAEPEAELANKLDDIGVEAKAAIDREDFATAMKTLAELRGPIDAFFDQVMVNVEDEAVRANRLALLARVRSAVEAIADFSRIEG